LYFDQNSFLLPDILPEYGDFKLPSFSNNNNNNNNNGGKKFRFLRQTRTSTINNA